MKKVVDDLAVFGGEPALGSLLTRHQGDLASTLSRFRLGGLFDEFVQIRPEEAKADYVVDPFGILIDDSFSERREVHLRTGIPTLDCSMLEMLFDERS